MLRLTREGIAIGPRHRLTLEEALFAHSIDAAYAVGADHRIGSLEPMKNADLTILGGDMRSMDAASVTEIPILATVVGGETRFTAE
jgi:predicted amidohydrolase YtcJ